MTTFHYALPRSHSWRAHANQVLADLFADGHVPTKAEIFNAYPFGMREYTPYKIWLEQVKWWQAGCPARPERIRPAAPVPEGQAVLL